MDFREFTFLGNSVNKGIRKDGALSHSGPLLAPFSAQGTAQGSANPPKDARHLFAVVGAKRSRPDDSPGADLQQEGTRALSSLGASRM
jgi:hypothetical protein